MKLTADERRELGQKIKTARKQKGLSQEQLADLIGYKVGTISKYEQGYRIPDIGVLLKIVEVLECDIADVAELSSGNPFKGREIPSIEENLSRYLDWLRSAQIPVNLSTFKDEDDVECVGISVELDGISIDISDNVFLLMEMSREHFVLLAKQFGENKKER